jgi:hypothetical protein
MSFDFESAESGHQAISCEPPAFGASNACFLVFCLSSPPQLRMCVPRASLTSLELAHQRRGAAHHTKLDFKFLQVHGGACVPKLLVPSLFRILLHVYGKNGSQYFVILWLVMQPRASLSTAKRRRQFFDSLSLPPFLSHQEKLHLLTSACECWRGIQYSN